MDMARFCLISATRGNNLNRIKESVSQAAGAEIDRLVNLYGIITIKRYFEIGITLQFLFKNSFNLFFRDFNVLKYNIVVLC